MFHLNLDIITASILYSLGFNERKSKSGQELGYRMLLSSTSELEKYPLEYCMSIARLYRSLVVIAFGL